MSVGFYFACAVPIGLSVCLNLLPLRVMLIWIGWSIAGNGLLYAMMRLNYNKRFKDPSLTIPQMLLSIFLVLYVQIYAGPLRGGYLLALMLAFAFGCFKLKTRQLIWLTLLTVLIYVGTIPMIMQIEDTRFNPAVELTLWVAFSIFMPSLAMLTGSFSDLRKKLFELNRKLTDLNRFDGLTGVKNRAYFNEKLDIEWRRALRAHDSLSLLMIDIDYFKRINDTYGHPCGDTCLQRVATMIKGAVQRPTDDTFRYGGEEFAVLLAATDSLGASHLAEIIRDQIEAADIICDGKKVTLTVSIGLSSMIPETNGTSDILVVKADGALYEAKETGRNRICIFSPQYVKSVELKDSEGPIHSH